MTYMSINLTPEIEQLVHGIYSGGAYTSESDVLTAALHLLQDRDRLRLKLQAGIEELSSGARLDASEVFEELRHRATELDGPCA